jgi:predicted component of type VI protein secretion system
MEAHVWSETNTIATQFFQRARMLDENTECNSLHYLTPTRSLRFPSKDYKVLSPLSTEVYFLSLLGANSPLPHHFNVAALFDECEAFYEFIALLNRIFYRALYAAWKSKHLHFFQSQRGIYHDLWAPYASTPWLARPYLQRTPTLMGLRCLLYRLCGNIPLQVKKESGYQPLNTGCALGLCNTPIRLSDNAILGQRVLSNEGRLSIVIGPLPCTEAKQWLPTENTGKKVLTEIKRYLGVSYILHWHILIAAQETRAQLNASAGLSRYAFLGSSGLPLEIEASM